MNRTVYINYSACISLSWERKVCWYSCFSSGVYFEFSSNDFVILWIFKKILQKKKWFGNTGYQISKYRLMISAIPVLAISVIDFGKSKIIMGGGCSWSWFYVTKIMWGTEYTSLVIRYLSLDWRLYWEKAAHFSKKKAFIPSKVPLQLIRLSESKN